jgi:hypothetical protein
MKLVTRDRYETTHSAVAPVVASVVLTFTHPILFLPKARGMLPCPMETRATASAASRVHSDLHSDPAHQRAQDGESARPLRGATRKRRRGERNDAPFRIPSGRCMGGSATRLPSSGIHASDMAHLQTRYVRDTLQIHSGYVNPGLVLSALRPKELKGLRLFVT